MSPDYPPAHGGIQVLAHRLVRHAARVLPRVVTLDNRDARAFDESEPIDVRRVRLRRHARRASIALLNARAVQEAHRFRPHVILSAHIVTAPAAQVIRRGRHTPVVQYVHGDELRARPRLGGFAVRGADLTVAVSAHSAAMALAAGLDPSRLRRIPPGVDIRELPSGYRSERPTLITVARLEDRYKGHDVLISAMSAILERVPDAQWLVVGDGSLRPELEELVSRQGLEGSVSFLGAVPDEQRDELLDQAHVFVMPSRLPGGEIGGEGFGIAYMEAAAHGLPVVAGNVGGALDAVVPDQTGLLVEPTDPDAVAEAVSGLLLDRHRAEAFGRAGAARAQAFAWERIARRVEDLLLELARGPG